ncbi:MAG: XrtA/PEP-CTERM system TPR-repeat protein PrsT [Thiotrichaceae bacterium]
MLNKINIQTWTLLIILALATLVLVACSDSNDLQMVQTAKKYLDGQKIREAALELRGALQKKPDNAEARYLLGLINLDVGDSAAAEKEFRHAGKAGWKEGDVQIGLARALINAHKFQDLIDEIEIKEDYLPTVRANLYGLRATAQASLSEVDQATKTLAAGTEIDENAFHLLKPTIQLQLVNGDLEGATNTLTQALLGHPNNRELLLLSAATAIQGEDQVSAMEAYRKVINQEPSKLLTVYGRNARLELARLEILEQNFDQAKSTLAPLVRMNANDPAINYLTGMLAFSEGNYERAEESLLKVLKVAPDHSQTHLLFGTVNFAQQDYEQAAYYIAKYVSAVPENLDARKLLGRTYMILGQQDEAQATLKTAMKVEGVKDAELLALVGISHLQKGNIRSGIEELEHALKIDPERASLRRELAKAYISAGETDHAIQQLKMLLTKDGGEEQAKTLLVIAYLRAGNFDQAINTVLEILTKKPKDPAVLTLAGNVFIASDDKQEARKYFNKALQLNPSYIPATMSLTRLEERQGNYAKAAALYKKVVNSDAQSIEPLLALARLAELQNKRKEMLNWLEQARERAPQNIKSRVMLAEYYLREKQIKKADLLVKEAIESGSREPVLLTLQSRILMANEHYDLALPFLNEVVTKTPDSVFPRALLSEIYLKLKQVKNARKQLEIILEKQPYYVPALVLIARVELKSGHYQQALKYAEQIQKVQPKLYRGYELTGDIRMVKKEPIEAKIAYTQAWELESSATLAIKLSEASKRSGKLEEAPTALLAWLNDHPDDAKLLQFLGSTYQDIGQNDKAIQTYEKVLAVQPNNMVALNNLAWLYSLSNNPKALGLAERAYQTYPNNVGIQDTYGWLLVQKGLVDKGRGLLKQAMEKLSTVSEVRYHYAVALLKSGKKRQAQQMLKKLLNEDKSFVGHEDAQQILALE